MRENSVIEIINVTLPQKNPPSLWGSWIDSPTKESQSIIHTIKVSGWALGKKEITTAIELSLGERVIKTIPVNEKRADVAQLFPDIVNAEQCGFSTTLGLIGLPLKGNLNCKAVLRDQTKVQIGVIEFIRKPLQSNYKPKLNPICLTTTGRSGSTWMMRLLSKHPQIVLCDNYPYEVRTASYWTHMLKVLTQPADHEESTPIFGFEQQTQWIGHNPFYSMKHIENQQIFNWFGRGYAEQLAGFCQQTIDQFYQRVANSQSQSNSEIMYFVEKWILTQNRQLFLEIYPQTREIILVRDFRDMVASVIAFNQKRGYEAFGREKAENTEEYICNAAKTQALTMVKTWRQRAKQAYLVRYEDLLLNPLTTLEQLLNYLNLDNSSSTIKMMLETASNDTSQLINHRTSFDPQASIGRWKHDLDPAIQSLCNEVFAEALTEFGYV